LKLKNFSNSAVERPGGKDVPRGRSSDERQSSTCHNSPRRHQLGSSSTCKEPKAAETKSIGGYTLKFR